MNNGGGAWRRVLFVSMNKNERLYWLYQYGVAMVKRAQKQPKKSYCGHCKKWHEVRQVVRDETCLEVCIVCDNEFDLPF